jgi:cytochrome c oxidase subunit 2
MTSGYNIIDPEKGVYQIPVDRAIAMMANNPNYLEPAESAAVDLDEMSPMERGEWLFHKSQLACASCHSVDGSSKQAPTMMGRFGKPSPLDDGTEVTFDDAYFVESLVEPKKKYAKGYDKAKNPAAAEMPAFKDQISEQQLEDLKAYLKSL